MRFTNIATRVFHNRTRTRSRPLCHLHTKSGAYVFLILLLLLLLQLVSTAKRFNLDENCIQKSSRPASFGIAFDIDGVIIRGEAPIGNSLNALKRLYEDSGRLKVPYLFLTNGGGVPESKRASDLSSLLGVNISTSQVLQGHTPFRDLVHRFQDGLVVALGKGEPAAVMSEYGFKKVLSIDEYASYFDNIDPLSHYKNWTSKKDISNDRMSSIYSAPPDRVQAAFIVSDSVDWSRDIQVLCDILRTGGLPGREIAHQPPLYFASDDLEYQAAFPSNRLGMGAFRIALESIFNRIHPKPLEYTSFGKPNPFVFKNAEAILKQLQVSTNIHGDVVNNGESESQTLKTLYMVGDNPSVDINGARQAGHPWFSILTRTGVFKGKGNDEEFPADLVVDTVEDAVEFILRRECTS